MWWFHKINHRNANLLDSPFFLPIANETTEFFFCATSMPHFENFICYSSQPPEKHEPTEKVPITAFLSIFSVTLFKNYRKRTLKILRSEVFQWPRKTLRSSHQPYSLRRRTVHCIANVRRISKSLPV